MQQSRCLLLAGQSCQVCMAEFTHNRLLGTVALPRPPCQALHSIPRPAATLLRSHRVAPATCPATGCGTAIPTTPRSEGLKNGCQSAEQGQPRPLQAQQPEPHVYHVGWKMGSQAHGRPRWKLKGHHVAHEIGGKHGPVAVNLLCL